MYDHGVPILCIIMVELKTGELLHLVKLHKTGTIYIQNYGILTTGFCAYVFRKDSDHAPHPCSRTAKALIRVLNFSVSMVAKDLFSALRLK